MIFSITAPFLHLYTVKEFVVGNKFITFVMKNKQFIRYLLSNGWYIVRQNGSHLILRHKEYDAQLTVPMHGAKEVGKGLQSRILKQINNAKKNQNEEN